MTIGTYQRICYTIIAVLAPGLMAVALHTWTDLNQTVVTVFAYALMVVWLVLTWRPGAKSRK